MGSEIFKNDTLEHKRSNGTVIPENIHNTTPTEEIGS